MPWAFYYWMACKRLKQARLRATAYVNNSHFERNSDALSKTKACSGNSAMFDGAWLDADNGSALPVKQSQPMAACLGTIPSFGAAETRRAIQAAQAASPGWAAKTGKERSQILRRWFDLCMQNQDDLAMILTLEQGKPLARGPGRDRPTARHSSSGLPKRQSAFTAT